MSIKEDFWWNIVDLQLRILIEYPESIYAHRFRELAYALRDSFVAVYDATLATFLPLQDDWSSDLLEAALQVSQSVMI